MCILDEFINCFIHHTCARFQRCFDSVPARLLRKHGIEFTVPR